MGLPLAACPRGCTAVSVGLEPGFGLLIGKPKYLFTGVCLRTAGILILFEQKLLLEDDKADRYSLKTAKLTHAASLHVMTQQVLQLHTYVSWYGPQVLTKVFKQNNYLHACVSWHGTNKSATPQHKGLHGRSKRRAYPLTG